MSKIRSSSSLLNRNNHPQRTSTTTSESSSMSKLQKQNSSSSSSLSATQSTTTSTSASKTPMKPKTMITKRKNRKNITLGLKLEIIKRLEKGESNSSICHEYNLPSSTVSTIRSKKEQIKAFCKNSAIVQNQYYQISYARNNNQNNFIDEIELSLYNWIKHRNYSIDTIRYSQVRDKALKLFENAKRQQQETMTTFNGGNYDNNNNNNGIEKMEFKPSHSWFERFRKRFCFENIDQTNVNVNNDNDDDDNNSSTITTFVNGNDNQSNDLFENCFAEHPIQLSRINNGNSNHNHNDDIITMMMNYNDDHHNNHIPISIDEPITVIEEEDDDDDDKSDNNYSNGIDTSQQQTAIMSKNNFENDIMELFWGKLVTSIFVNEKINSNNSSGNGGSSGNQQQQQQQSINRLDAQSLAIVFKLSEAIINILESRDNDLKRFLGFKQNLAHILHPYREIYNQKLSLIKDSLKNLHQHQMVTPQSRRRQRQRQQQQYQNNYWPPSTFDNGGDNVE
ncbi:hypothetical protein DERF_001055 [Dermatophagoides farinae]|uniref:HTH CENPB-type domain-containing protein n=1 Tax=Dermatophagoides farinae TaxID=6954 RepID=A0A922L8B2_DERFA|nr:hypothetical protein DERF_001055 [Dermatophagoides farinae]